MLQGAEMRPALGVEVLRFNTNSGDIVLPKLYTSFGSGWVPLERVPNPDGKVSIIGESEPVRSASGQLEIKWNMGWVKPGDGTRLVDGYIKDNGYRGDPEVLKRAYEMMRP